MELIIIEFLSSDRVDSAINNLDLFCGLTLIYIFYWAINCRHYSNMSM